MAQQEHTAAASVAEGSIDDQMKEESDGESMTVPEIGGEPGHGPSISGQEIGVRLQGASSEGAHKKRGRSQVDKENKRLKRLLRNRVSAQQARERKKAYVNDLEVKLKDLENKNSALEEKLSTLQNENQMLRQILKNTTTNRGVNDEGSIL